MPRPPLFADTHAGSSVSRRRFVQGLAVASAGTGLAASHASALSSGRLAGAPATLSGDTFELEIGESEVNFTGRVRPAITVNGSLPGPTLRCREGDTLTLKVSNALSGTTQTAVHWHGIVLPANMDGVPGMSFDGIYPGETYLYRFPMRQAGTYWYHSHSLHQEQAGLYGALIVEPLHPAPYRYDREHVVLLSDWTDLDPSALFRRLKKDPGYDNHYRRTVGDFMRDVRAYGLGSTLSERAMWGRMRMTPTDLSDVNANTYTYLMNGVTPAGNWTGVFQPGERVLLRLINAANMTYFDLRIPGLKMTVVAADGQYVQPVEVDELRLAVAETYDVIVEPTGADAFTLFAQDMGRTGYACGTLAVAPGLSAPVPEIDPRPILSMMDMGMSHASGGGRGAHASAGAGSDRVVHPASEHNNPLVDMQTDTATAKLDDPGLGLRDTDRRVLTYADLNSLFPDPDGREPSREIELHLTGNMERFAWSFNGVPFAEAEPLRLTYGERIRLILVNDTMMQHPVHLHGMWSDLEDENHRFKVRKHTVDMPPGSRRSYRIRADALGRWAFHCHLLYHMDGGMMREVRVEEA
jgi:FtsP/CotA-like multicopper oxidase with cupredoxin domain